MAKTKSNQLLKILVVAAIIILIPILTPNMYIMQIINMICIYIILGIGINVLTGFTGQLSLGQAAFFGIGAYTTAIMNTRGGMQFFTCLIGSGSEGKGLLSGSSDHGLRRDCPDRDDQLDSGHQRYFRYPRKLKRRLSSDIPLIP